MVLIALQSEYINFQWSTYFLYQFLKMFLNISTKINGKPLDLLQSCVNAFGGGAGFGLALIIFAGIREDMELVDVPASLRGTPIAFLTAALLSMAFMGFAGLVTL